MSDKPPVLAVYDFRSKQEFIYRTNRMREITGASELIAGMYKAFLTETEAGKQIKNDWRDNPSAKLLDDSNNPIFDDGKIGVVVYEGGGSLLVLYRNRDAYIAANKQFSRKLIDKAYSLSMVTGAADWNPKETFDANRTRAFEEFDRAKRAGNASVPCNVLPYTLVDRTTFQPIVKKNHPTFGEITEEEKRKLAAYEKLPEDRKNEGKFIDEIGAKKGEDSLIAVLYFDGNSIGERVKSAVEDGVKQGKTEVQAMREFSKKLHEALVENTEKAMKRAIYGLSVKHWDCRVIIDHGDEITLICNAHAAPIALDAYFKAIEGSGYHACCGMAFCHSHDPFAEVYRIAEECCESGKKRNREVMSEAMGGLTGDEALKAAREADASYVDFHFCRSGITGSLEQIREAQDGRYTRRPFRVDSEYKLFLEAGERLAKSEVKRSDLKELNRAILRGDSWYALEYERVKAKDLTAIDDFEEMACGQRGCNRFAIKELLFDLTSFFDVYDLRFGVKGADDGKEA